MFNEIIYRKDNIKPENREIVLRRAVRAIIIHENNILMAHLRKTGEYKLPGGGIENNETINDAIRREVREEAGYLVSKINEKIGEITEYGSTEEDENNNRVFKMISECYLAEVDNNRTEQDLDEHEKEYDYRPCWVNMEEAYKTNKALVENGAQTTKGIKREIKILEMVNAIYGGRTQRV
jgi:8-oxo-dGTP pyrophosphatase MutT (NUDIX family)